MTKGFRILVMLLALVLGFAANVHAQGNPQQNGPTDTVRQAYENGAIIVDIKAITPIPGADGGPMPRNYAYRIGDVVTFQVAIITNPGIAINVENLLRGRFDPQNGSDYEPAAAPQVQRFEQDGRQVVLIVVRARTWVPKSMVAFNFAFLYATGNGNSGEPNWQPAMSPAYQVTYSRTAVEESKNLDEGDTTLKVPPRAMLSTPMAYTAYTLFGLVALVLAVMLFRVLFPPRVPAPNVVAWKKFNAVLKKSGDGISYDDTATVAAVLRNYLGVDTVADEGELQTALERFFEKDANKTDLARAGQQAIAILDGALYKRPESGDVLALTPTQKDELFSRIEMLVERP